MIATTKYLKPLSVQEALKAAGAHRGEFRFVAGGTDVMVNRYQKNESSSCFIDISGLKELQSIIESPEELRIGSMVTLDDLEHHPVISSEFHALSEAAHNVASPVIRRSATLGGNLLCENRCSFYNQSEWWREAIGYCLKCDGDICIATGGKKACFSKFVSDTAPVLISMNAMVEIVTAEGQRTAPLESIYSNEGVQPRTLPECSIILFVILPRKQQFRSVFMKLRPREAVDFTSLTTAVTISASGKIRVVVGGVDPGPVLVEGDQKDDPKRLIELAVKKCRVVDNDFYTRKYRKEMIGVFLEKSFNKLTA